MLRPGGVLLASVPNYSGITQRLIGKKDRYVGIDVSPETNADFVVQPGETWPFEASVFDAVLATQVLEHVNDLDNVVSEIDRILRPGGIALLTLPFIYSEHGAPADFRRFTVDGAALIFPGDWTLDSETRLGGVGSAAGQLVLNWIDETMNLTGPGRVLKGLFLPVWILLSAVVNALGATADRIDRTSGAYVNLAVVFRKPSA